MLLISDALPEVLLLQYSCILTANFITLEVIGYMRAGVGQLRTTCMFDCDGCGNDACVR